MASVCPAVAAVGCVMPPHPPKTAILLTAPGQERAAERSEGDINPLSYIKRNTICVKERWDALK